jgi:hypothetical protein
VRAEAHEHGLVVAVAWLRMRAKAARPRAWVVQWAGAEATMMAYPFVSKCGRRAIQQMSAQAIVTRYTY